MTARSDGSLLFDTKLDTSGLSTGLSGIGGVAKTALAGVAGLTAAGVAGFAALTKASVEGVASLEQNIGGVETLFGEAADTVLANAEKAYQTAGLSANDYMSTVTSFAASLKQSCETEAEAAEVANMAVTDMSDNANKMGTSMEAIQNAYQGFAKQNYTMLDNLKLGYGGTKTEMERLLVDAEKVSGVKYDINNLNDVYQAIHVIQSELGITGTTAKEASTTIEGSMNSAKAAWDNFLSGAGDASELADALSTVADVLVQNLGEIVPRLAEGLPDLFASLSELLPDLLSSLLPSLITGAEALLNGLIEVLPDIFSVLMDCIPMIIDVILSALPLLLDAAIQIIEALATGIAQALPSLIPQIVNLVLSIGQTLIENLPMLIEAAIQLFLGLVTGLVQALPQIIAALPTLINSIINALIASIPMLIECGVELFLALIENLPAIIVAIVEAVPQIVKALVRGFIELAVMFKETGSKLMDKLKEGLTGMLSNLVDAAKDLGKNIIDGIWNGISAGWNWLKEKVGGLASGLFDAAKSALGIASPSKKFRYLGEMCVAGFDEGIADLMSPLDIGASINASMGTIAANTGGGFGVAGNSQTFNFYDTQTSPDAIRRKVQNTMTFGLAGGI